ncbi:MAG: TIGR04255 family protein [Patescibacteria group bacterium]
MPFKIPACDHEVFKRNFLSSVICQIKVQPIFRIASDTPPADFQDKIRKQYPIVKKERAEQVEVRGGDFRRTSLGNTWRFLSEDHLWQVTLDSAFIALETKNYKSFTEFRKKFEEIYDAFVTTYAPSRPERIGLRYNNLIRAVNIRTISDWTKWIKPELIGLIGSDSLIQEPVTHDFKELQTIQEPGQLGIKHGLLRDQEKSQFYLIDIDRYIMGAKNQEETSRFLAKFNEDCFNFFMWAIGEECVKWLRGGK